MRRFSTTLCKCTQRLCSVRRTFGKPMDILVIQRDMMPHIDIYRHFYLSLCLQQHAICDFFPHRNVTIAMTQTPLQVLFALTQSNQIWTETVGKFGVVFSSRIFWNIFKITNFYINSDCFSVFWSFSGEACVHIAAEKNHIEILKHLCRIGANINARVSSTHPNPKFFLFFILNWLTDFLPLIRFHCRRAEEDSHHYT